MTYNENVFIEKVNLRKLLYPGDLIDVEFPEQHIVANSRILDMSFQKRIAVILPPYHKNRKIETYSREKIIIRFYDFSASVLFKSHILKNSMEGIIIYLPRIAYRIQKRMFFRVSIIREGILLDEENNKKIRFETRDFSAGGMQIITKSTLEKDKRYILKNLTITDDLILEDIETMVVRSLGQNLYKENIYGMKFLNVNYKLEKKIVRFANLYSIKARHGAVGE
ncbi:MULTISPECIES: flagellar brake protein [unclassified Marinitoga]|uniref:flagellar brake protein n=1 Tax=unclassified Marinitoga TaxID=2640159 RepID=UPI00095099A0|nr:MULTISPECIES: PilZ domain-containing protein [unclassified Marinitoga]APT76614.1 hypothetical protein LN42_09665 [Marinitoga sp. 1137]NUU98311.1 hypothetical protein [Marinitoga sp. 1138]